MDNKEAIIQATIDLIQRRESRYRRLRCGKSVRKRMQDWDRETLERRTFCLIAAMQQSFLRSKVILQTQGIDLTNPKERRVFHDKMLRDILGEGDKR